MGLMQVELRVLELICSRLCHELISPVTAINNGMELVADGGADMLVEVSDLLTGSAAEASGVLQFYRIAYGLGGQDAPPISLGEAKRLTEGLVRDGKVKLDWTVGEAGSDGGLGRRGMKLLLNVLVMGIDALPRGGTLAIRLESGAPGVTLESVGTGARIEAASREAYTHAAAVDALTARNVHAYFTSLVAADAGGTVELTEEQNRVTLRLKL
jgi:histidine phosphotransferase ChpT